MCRSQHWHLDDVVFVDVSVNVFDLLDNLVYVPHLFVHVPPVCVCVVYARKSLWRDRVNVCVNV